jgi:hypothetical protein
MGRMDWIELAQDRDRWRVLVNSVMNLLFLQNSGNFLTNRGPVRFSRRAVLHGVSYLIGNIIFSIGVIVIAVLSSA